MAERNGLRRRRLRRLQEELDDAGVGTGGHHGPLLLSEIDRARFPRRHEGRFPSYGAIVVSRRSPAVLRVLDELGAIRLKGDERSSATIRRMADGMRGFALVQREEVELVLLASPASREIELVRLRRALGPSTALVNRSVEGIVRVIEHRQIVTFDGTTWWVKPDAREYSTLVSSSMGLAPLDLTEHILDFCVHVAGPGAGGATLVWCLDEEAETLLDRHSAHTEPPLSLRLPLGNAASYTAVRHLLVHTDGACRVSHDGDVVEVGLHLRASSAAHRDVEIARNRGTRHASAKRCSYDIPTALVFVVSDDGPVTVYGGGRTVASIEMSADDRGEPGT